MKLFSVVTLVAAFSLVACGGGGSRKVVGKQCPAGNYQPFSMTNLGSNQKKLSLKPEDKQIPAGKYSYEGATIYYVDKSDLRVQAQDSKQKDGKTFNATTACIRNAKNTLNPFNVQAVRTLDVTADNKFLVEVSNYTIGLEATKFKVKAVQDPVKKLESPAEAYLGTKEAFMVATDKNETNYEIRSQGGDANGTYIVQILLTRKPL